jgi:predicted PurR-regulated permease PerM
MDFDQITKDFHSIWQNQPLAIILLIAGFLIFVFVVVDAWFHKRRRKRPPLH